MEGLRHRSQAKNKRSRLWASSGSGGPLPGPGVGVRGGNLHLGICSMGFQKHNLPPGNWSTPPDGSGHFLPSAYKQQGHLTAAAVSWLEGRPLQTFPRGCNLGIFSQATLANINSSTEAWPGNCVTCGVCHTQRQRLHPKPFSLTHPSCPPPKKSKNHLQGGRGDR